MSIGTGSRHFDRDRKDVSGPAFCLDQLRIARVGLELAAQTQDLHVDAAIENLLVVHAARGEKLLAAQDMVRRLKKRGQEIELSCRQRHRLPGRMDATTAFTRDITDVSPDAGIK
jgi:hypothetical protein